MLGLARIASMRALAQFPLAVASSFSSDSAAETLRCFGACERILTIGALSHGARRQKEVAKQERHGHNASIVLQN